jgi:myosin-1
MKAQSLYTTHKHFRAATGMFTIVHYAGDVTYNVNGFCERNRDTLSADLITLMQSSSSSFIQHLFPDVLVSEKDARQARTRTPTAGSRIRVCSVFSPLRATRSLI